MVLPYNIYMMKRFTTIFLLCSTLTMSACTVMTVDPRCQRGQYCAYTDPPSPIRTEVLRSGSFKGDPAAR